MAVSEEKKELSPKDKLLIEIGKRMKELRILEGFNSHENFAFEKGINRSQYGKYEKGRSDLQISTLIKIILSYKNMTVSKFFEGMEIPDDLE